MHSCSLNELAKSLSSENRKTLRYPVTMEKISSLSELKHKSLYDKKPDQSILKAQPWKNLPKYFSQVLISALAFVKMSIHAKSGGSIEIMGMLTGKIVGNSIVVMDVYSLPVEGTETRVNAQNEAYEYMVQYLDMLKSVGREEHIVGWYHSHPGYGCWLSGIDVATQSLNQNFQDPYLAIVVDPVQTVNQGKVEIGAFRTLPVGYNAEKNRQVNIKSKSKKADFGIHADQYYSLDIELFKSKKDEEYIDMILNKSWVLNLLRTTNSSIEYDKRLAHAVDVLFEAPNTASQMKDAKAVRKFDSLFEDRVAKLASETWESKPDYMADEDMISPEGSVPPSLGRGGYEDEDDDDEDDEDDEQLGDDEEQSEDNENGESYSDAGLEETVNGKKRVLDSKSSVYFEPQQARNRKRFAAGESESTLNNEFKHKMQQAQAELKKEHRAVSAVGHAELASLLTLRTQKRVFCRPK